MTRGRKERLSCRKVRICSKPKRSAQEISTMHFLDYHQQQTINKLYGRKNSQNKNTNHPPTKPNTTEKSYSRNKSRKSFQTFQASRNKYHTQVTVRGPVFVFELRPPSRLIMAKEGAGKRVGKIVKIILYC